MKIAIENVKINKKENKNTKPIENKENLVMPEGVLKNDLQNKQ